MSSDALLPNSASLSVTAAIAHCTNGLIGMGLLALPFALKESGWIFGLGFLIGYSIISAETAVILIKCIDYVEVRMPLPGFVQVVEVALGLRAKRWVTWFLLIDLFSSATIYLIIAGDSLHVLYPYISVNSCKIIMFICAFPTLMARSLSFLAYSSVVGVITSVSLVSIILYNGFMTHARTIHGGSILDPMPTDLFPSSPTSFIFSASLLIVGYEAHALFPSIYRDMKRPGDFSKMIRTTYWFVGLVYSCTAIAGYLMFGRNVHSEVTQTLPLIPAFNKTMTRIILWIVTINPLTKIGLILTPIHAHFEAEYQLRKGQRFLYRLFIGLTSLTISIGFPKFESVIGVAGSIFSFTVIIILPILCYIKIFERRMSPLRKCMYYSLICVAGLFAFLGVMVSGLH